MLIYDILNVKHLSQSAVLQYFNASQVWIEFPHYHMQMCVETGILGQIGNPVET